MAFITNSSLPLNSLVSKLIFIFLFFLTSTNARKLQLSTDNGSTWQPFETPFRTPPETAAVRLLGNPSTVIHLPACALTGSLRIQVWRTKLSKEPIGLRWQSSACHPHLTLPNGIIVEDLAPPRRKPEWLGYLRQNTQDDPKLDSNSQQQKGFFSKYSLYIMIFVGVALGHGIRKGLAELYEEMEREEKAKKRKKTPPQLKVVVPRRKESSKTRKRVTLSTPK